MIRAKPDLSAALAGGTESCNRAAATAGCSRVKQWQLCCQPGAIIFSVSYGILLTGAVPVPIYPPVRRSQLEDHLHRHSGILNNCIASILITIPEAKVVARLLKSQVLSLREVVTVK